MALAIVVAGLLAVGSAGANAPVTVYVGPMVRDGFVDVDQGVLDSIKDLQAELGKDRNYAVVRVEEGATLKLYVVTRAKIATGASAGVSTASGTAIGSQVIGSGMTINVPIEVMRLETLLRVGSYERRFTGESDAAWKSSAKAVAKDLAVWLAANRQSIPGR